MLWSMIINIHNSGRHIWTVLCVYSGLVGFETRSIGINTHQWYGVAACAGLVTLTTHTIKWYNMGTTWHQDKIRPTTTTVTTTIVIITSESQPSPHQIEKLSVFKLIQCRKWICFSFRLLWNYGAGASVTFTICGREMFARKAALQAHARRVPT